MEDDMSEWITYDGTNPPEKREGYGWIRWARRDYGGVSYLVLAWDSLPRTNATYYMYLPDAPEPEMPTMLIRDAEMDYGTRFLEKLIADADRMSIDEYLDLYNSAERSRRAIKYGFGATRNMRDN